MIVFLCLWFITMILRTLYSSCLFAWEGGGENSCHARYDNWWVILFIFGNITLLQTERVMDSSQFPWITKWNGITKLLFWFQRSLWRNYQVRCVHEIYVCLKLYTSCHVINIWDDMKTLIYRTFYTYCLLSDNVCYSSWNLSQSLLIYGNVSLLLTSQVRSKQVNDAT